MNVKNEITNKKNLLIKNQKLNKKPSKKKKKSKNSKQNLQFTLKKKK